MEIIGVAIKEEVRKSNMTQDDFADAMGMSLRNVANLFNKEHIPHDQLIKASKVLKKDFLKLYSEYLHSKYPELDSYSSGPIVAEEKQHIYEARVHEISFQLNIKGTFEKVQKEMPDLIRIIKEQAELRGLSLA
ncbi:MAG: helix-turn-helix transcriptional regulator [Pseudosphingobacterium sp.]|nr:helix-turn-helix transcriptional regulator [Pseudosphingobacterium sp.]